ncbi:MAG: DNA-binding protein, partial [Thiohalomonadales bacterium]
RVAGALDCELYYALVPRQSIEAMVQARAQLKAEMLVSKTDVQMKLEAQQLSKEKLQEHAKVEMERLVREMPRELWED